ncbi:hypothetical protein AVEN_270927-1 [Araneus ventricosus]|uniref:Uncharacterized protein n=1 Tax=Araneus ventricosus TaxID=182803 RepID=A0A4Y2R7I0_ARAVE|nr:hypothetical protein AVEN_270927-1 [Araneus ventricosus]
MDWKTVSSSCDREWENSDWKVRLNVMTREYPAVITALLYQLPVIEAKLTMGKWNLKQIRKTLEQAGNYKVNSMEIEHSANNVIIADMTTNIKSDNIEIDSIGEVINTVIANNCNEIDMSKGEMPECNAEIMNIDSPDSNLISAENDGYQTQGRKRGRVPSNESIPSKKTN